MDWIIAVSLGAKLGVGLFALAALLWFASYVDTRRGIDYMRDVLPIINSDPLGLAIWRAARWLGMCILLGMVLGCTPAQAGPIFPNTYDKQIYAASERYLPGLPPLLWKAQLYQESRLDPNARSPVGALGLAQFMPATWKEVSTAMKYGLIDRRIAEPAIMGGAYYMMTLRRRWTMDDMDRHKHAVAGYNAGNGSISRASRACGHPEAWADTAACLPSITGHHSKETDGYVRMIFTKWWPAMEAAR